MLPTKTNRIMKNLEKISERDLTKVVCMFSDIVKILNVDELSFSDMLAGDDEDLGRLEWMRAQVFGEIQHRAQNRARDGQRQVAEMLVKTGDYTFEEAMAHVDEVVYLLRNEDDIDRCYDILADELGLEPDYLNILMGW